jgi:ABC-type nitrate/sulfonate/bicarbonate transport system substrate-binding protein
MNHFDSIQRTRGLTAQWHATLIAAVIILAPIGIPSRGQGQEPVRVSIAQSQDILAFAPAYIARARFFKEMGVEAQFEILSGGGPVAASVSGGSTHFGLTSSSGVVNVAAKGEDFIAIAGLNYQTIEVVFNKKWAERKGVTKSSPIKARVEAMRGATIASTSPGALTDTVAQYLLRWVGMEPGRDAQIVPIGAMAPRLAALQSDRVEVLLSSPPAGQIAEKEGYGIVLIPAEDLPGFNRQLNEVLMARKSWLQRNRAAAVRVATALALANNYFLDNFKESVSMHEPFFKKTGRAILEQGLRPVQAQTLRNGTMKADDWTKTVELLNAIGDLKGKVDTKEGGFWTNEYIDLNRVKK